jgi:plastocyanin
MPMLKRLAVLAVPVAVAGAVAVPALAATTTTVKLKDDFFTSKTLKIAKGTTVKWVWAGESIHNVSVTEGPAKFRSRLQSKGSYSHTFAKRGKYTIVCTIHSEMVSTVTVK